MPLDFSSARASAYLGASAAPHAGVQNMTSDRIANTAFLNWTISFLGHPAPTQVFLLPERACRIQNFPRYLGAAVHQLMNQTILGRPTRSISTAPQSGTIRNALCDITP